jgi:hypothetical protein
MSRPYRCLIERELLFLVNREGSLAQQTHLASRQNCATKYRRLESELATISQILRAAPPAQTINENSQPFAFHWVPRFVAVTLVVVLVWGGAHFWGPSRPTPMQGFSSEEIRSLLEDFSADIFFLNEANAEEIWNGDGDDDGLGALEEEGFPARDAVEELEILADWPCPLCVERSRNLKLQSTTPQLSKKLGNYRMEVLR